MTADEADRAADAVAAAMTCRRCIDHAVGRGPEFRGPLRLQGNGTVAAPRRYVCPDCGADHSVAVQFIPDPDALDAEADRVAAGHACRECGGGLARRQPFRGPLRQPVFPGPVYAVRRFSCVACGAIAVCNVEVRT